MKEQASVSCRSDCNAIKDLNHHYHYFVPKISHDLTSVAAACRPSIESRGILLSLETFMPALRAPPWMKVHGLLRSSAGGCDEAEKSADQSAAQRAGSPV